jgi:hypothetical protein
MQLTETEDEENEELDSETLTHISGRKLYFSKFLAII